MSWLSKFLKPESDLDRLLLNLTTGALAQTAIKGLDPGWKSKWREPAIMYGPALATAGLAALRGERGIVPLLGAGLTGEAGKRVAGQVFGRAPRLDQKFKSLEDKTLRQAYESANLKKIRADPEKWGWSEAVHGRNEYPPDELELFYRKVSPHTSSERGVMLGKAQTEAASDPSLGLSGLWREEYDPTKKKWTGYDPIKIGGLATGFTYAASLYDEAEKQKRRKNLGPETTKQVRELAKSTLRDYEYAVREVEDNLNLTDEQKAEQIEALQIKYRISLVRKLEDLGPRGPVVAAHGGYIRGYQEGGVANLPQQLAAAPAQQLAAAPATAPVSASTPVPTPQGIAGLAGGAQRPSMAASLENLTDEQLDKQIETIVVSELTRRGIEITREIIEMAIAKFRADNNIPYKNEATEDYSPMTFTPRTTAESLMSGESTTPPGMEDVALAAGGGYLDRYRYGGMIDPLYEMGGFVDGPGGPKTDSIPARLSDGEFVMTAEAVEGSGGPGVMYDLMDYFESRA